MGDRIGKCACEQEQVRGTGGSPGKGNDVECIIMIQVMLGAYTARVDPPEWGQEWTRKTTWKTTWKETWKVGEKNMRSRPGEV